MVCNLLRNNYWRIQNTNCFLHKAATTHAARKLRLVIKEEECLARRDADIRCTRHLPSRTAILDPGKPHRRALRQESREKFVGVEITPFGIAGALQDQLWRGVPSESSPPGIHSTGLACVTRRVLWKAQCDL